MPPRRKRPLTGAAKDAHEMKLARVTEQACQSDAFRVSDPIEVELDRLSASASSTETTLDAARSRLNRYVKSNPEDNTDQILLELLKELPLDGRQNLIPRYCWSY